jgi:hypothetical protein
MSQAHLATMDRSTTSSFQSVADIVHPEHARAHQIARQARRCEQDLAARTQSSRSTAGSSGSGTSAAVSHRAGIEMGR